MDRKEIKYLLNYLENNPGHLNSLQNKFVASLKELYMSTGFLTKRQVECLYEMKEDIGLRTLEEVVYESMAGNYQAQYSSFDSLTPFNI